MKQINPRYGNNKKKIEKKYFDAVENEKDLYIL
jgi:hypothetical protein